MRVKDASAVTSAFAMENAPLSNATRSSRVMPSPMEIPTVSLSMTRTFAPTLTAPACTSAAVIPFDETSTVNVSKNSVSLTLNPAFAISRLATRARA